MTGKINKIYPFLFIPLLFLCFQSCVSIAPFSEAAYQQAVRLKVESLDLMSRATDVYSNHTAEIDSLKLGLKIAYEYAKGRPDNEITTKQWEIMINPDRNLIGGFLRIWKEDLILSPVFINEAQGVIGDAFDSIIGLESGKIKASDLPDEQADLKEEN
jgi:hypothetical protein